MTCKVLIRSYRYGDDNQIKSLNTEGAMGTVWPFFLASARREAIAQIVLMVAALLFIVVGLPLHYSLISLPLVMFLLFVGVWIGHRVKITKGHGDLNDVQNMYIDKQKCGFWVAELLSPSAEKSGNIPLTKDDVLIIREDHTHSHLDRTIFGTDRRIIGTIAVAIKEDPDLREPPASVAWIRRMCVTSKFRRKGIASALVDVALEHCARSNFRAVELFTSEHHWAARSLYAGKGFDLVETSRKLFIGGLLAVSLYRLRLPCVVARSQLNA